MTGLRESVGAEISGQHEKLDGFLQINQQLRKILVLILGLASITFFAYSVLLSLNLERLAGNLYAYQADAFLHGRLYMLEAPPEPVHDFVPFRGHYYIPFPPFPALLLLPFVSFFGIAGTSETAIAVGMTIISAWLLIEILRKNGVSVNHCYWIGAAFFLGTGYWLSVLFCYGVWSFAQIVSTACLLFAINEAFGKGRGWLVGLCLGLSVLSRQSTIFTAIFLVAVLWENQNVTFQGKHAKEIAGFTAMLAICVSLYLWFNWARFGSPLDTGYEYIALQGFLKERVDSYGLFNVVYLPFNFIYLFLQGVHFEFAPGTLLQITQMDAYGTSLTFGSPFVFLALWARGNRKVVTAAWISVLSTLFLALLYYNNGYYQINAQRFTLDFLPVLIVLVGIGAKYVKDWPWKLGAVYAISLNILGLVFFRSF